MNAIIKTVSITDPIATGIAAYLDEIIALRHDLHQYPELAFQDMARRPEGAVHGAAPCGCAAQRA